MLLLRALGAGPCDVVPLACACERIRQLDDQAGSCGFSFVRDLEAVEQRLSTCLAANPAQAVGLYETFLAGCYEKAGEVDDSSGTFGDCVGRLQSEWVTAREAAGADPDETASRLLAWMEADPYGFCHSLERDAARVLTKAGLGALISQVRERFDKAGTIKPGPAGSFSRDAASARRRWGAALRTLYVAQKSVDATGADLDSLIELLLETRELERLADLLRRSANETQWIEIPAPTRGAPSRSRSFPASASANSRERMRCIRSNASRSPV